MKNTLKKFQIFTTTEFGFGLIRKKANSFEDAFNRLSHSEKMRAISVMDDDGEEVSKDEILNSISYELSLC